MSSHFFCLVAFRVVCHMYWYVCGVEWHCLLLSGEDALNELLDKQRPEEDVDRRISENSKDYVYASLSNSDVKHACSDDFDLLVGSIIQS